MSGRNNFGGNNFGNNNYGSSNNNNGGGNYQQEGGFHAHNQNGVDNSANKSAGKRDINKPQIVVPLTIKLLQEAEKHASMSDSPYLELNGQQFDQFTVVARFQIPVEQTGRSILEINDDTGVIFATVHKKNQGEMNVHPRFLEEILNHQNIAGDRDKVYVKFYINPRVTNKQVQYYVQMGRLLESHNNELTRHHMEVILRHCQRLKGVLPSKESASQQAGQNQQSG
jgi:hypothetical protein